MSLPDPWRRAAQVAMKRRRGPPPTAVIFRGSDETDAEAIKRAQAAGVVMGRRVVIIRRFCKTVADLTGGKP